MLVFLLVQRVACQENSRKLLLAFAVGPGKEKLAISHCFEASVGFTSVCFVSSGKTIAKSGRSRGNPCFLGSARSLQVNHRIVR